MSGLSPSTRATSPHFDGKDGLFTAVFEEVEATSPLAALQAGIDVMLDAALDPGLAQIVLIDAPAVLGWEAWRAIGWRYGMGLTDSVLAAAMDAGELPRRPVRPLAHVLLGALDEAVLYVARAEDQRTARTEMAATLSALLAGLRA